MRNQPQFESFQKLEFYKSFPVLTSEINHKSLFYKTKMLWVSYK